MGAMADALKEKVEEAHALAKNLEGLVPTAYLDELGAERRNLVLLQRSMLQP